MKTFRSATAITKLAFAVAFLSLLTLAGVRFVQAAWTPPTSAPPGGNVAAPLNVSGVSQTKQGSLTIGGEYFSVSGGDIILGRDFLMTTDDRGMFWADSSDPTKPHIESASDILYLSPGENAGSGTEIQGDVKIATLGLAAPVPGSLAIENSVNERILAFSLASGALGVDIKSKDKDETPGVEVPLFLNYDTGQKVQIGSNAKPVQFCLNDDPAFPDPTKCISSWGGGLWTLTGNNLYPQNLAWNVGVGTVTPGTKLEIQANANTSGAGGDNSQIYITGQTNPEKRLSIAFNTSSNYGELQARAWVGGYAPLVLNPNGGNVGINTVAPNQELGLSGDLALSGGIYKLNGTTKFFADTCSGANLSIKTINADGSVTCEADDGGAGSSYTAENGLTLNGNAFGLGGLLIRDTQIDLQGWQFRYNMTGAGDFLVMDNGNTVFEVRDNGGVYLQNLANCTGASTLDVDANGLIICGTDDSGGAGGDSLWAGVEGADIYPKTPSSTEVGIGLSDPQNRLDVGWTGGGYQALRRDDTTIIGNDDLGALYFTGDDGATGAIGAQIKGRATADWSANDYPAKLMFLTAPDGGTALERMTILDNGNIGISNSAPTYKMDVTDTLRLVASGRTDGVLTEHTGSGNYRTGMISSGLYQLRANRIGFVTPEGGSTDRLFINAAGNVGVGTTNPTVKLDVADGIRVSHATNPYLFLNKSNAPARDAYLEIVNDNLALTYTGSQRLVIDPSGNVKIPYLANCNGVNTVDADANGNLVCGADVGGGAGDNLGNHIATQNLQMGSFYISNDGGNEGINIDTAGRVALSNTPNAGGETFQLREPAGGSEWAGFGYDGAGNNVNMAVHAGSQVQTFQIDYDDPVFSFDTASVADALVIQKAGNVGIGTGSPGAKLDIAAAASGTALQIGTNTATEITLSGASGANIGAPNSNLYLLAGAGLGVHLGSNNTNSQVILSGGNLVEFNSNIRGNQSGAIRILTATGNMDIGSQNASYAHLYTDRDRFYFNKRIVVDGGFSSYSNNNLVLETGETARLTIRGNGAGAAAGNVGIANAAADALLAVASGTTPYNANHTLTSYNNSTTNYNAVSGFKSGANIRGSGVSGGLVAGTTCAGSSVCAGIYGSDGSASYPVQNGTWAGYFNGDVNVADQLNVNTAISTNTIQATNISVTNVSGFTLGGNMLINGLRPMIVRQWDFLGGTQGDLAQDTGVHSNNYTCTVAGYFDKFDVQENDERDWELFAYTGASAKWGGTTWWIRQNYGNHNAQERPYKIIVTCVHNFLTAYQAWTGCQANTDSGWSSCSGPSGGGY